VFTYGHTGKGIILGIMLGLLFILPAIGNGEESTAPTSEKNSEVHQTPKADSGLTMSDVMSWVRRSGNRVGENLSEAASKTASAIKKVATGDKQNPPSEDSP
jgi:hypothetical protein